MGPLIEGLTSCRGFYWTGPPASVSFPVGTLAITIPTTSTDQSILTMSTPISTSAVTQSGDLCSVLMAGVRALYRRAIDSPEGSPQVVTVGGKFSQLERLLMSGTHRYPLSHPLVATSDSHEIIVTR